MRKITIVYYSPLGTCEEISQRIGREISAVWQDAEIELLSLTHADERKAAIERGVSCDLLFLVFPMYAQNMPRQVAEMLEKCEINATFASMVCAYGKGNPTLALRRVRVVLTKKGMPTVSAMHLPVGRVHKEKTGSPVLPEYDCAGFVESTLSNADVGERARLSCSAEEKKAPHYYL